MTGCKEAKNSRRPSYASQSRNPLIDRKHHRTTSEGGGSAAAAPSSHMRRDSAAINDNKENFVPNVKPGKTYCKGKENAIPNPNDEKKAISNEIKDNLLKQSSLQLCIKKHEPESSIETKIWGILDLENSNSVNIWDYSDSEAAPASSWSTLPNRSLLCRPLPVDVGRCTCIIVKESSSDGFGGSYYTLYTNEGQGRQNRKLAVAQHRRRKGRSEFIIAQNTKGITSKTEDSLIGIVTSNLMGSKYYIWDQVRCLNSLSKQSKLLAVVKFMPTVYTWTGNHRSMKAWIPIHQSMQLKNVNQIQHINGLPTEYTKKDKVHQLFSKVPYYSKISKQYELDFRDKGRAGLKIKSSVKNFQLTLESNGKQTILQLGRVGKSKYVMDYRYPLTGYQAFSMCLASIDSKLCCTV